MPKILPYGFPTGDSLTRLLPLLPHALANPLPKTHTSHPSCDTKQLKLTRRHSGPFLVTLETAVDGFCARVDDYAVPFCFSSLADNDSSFETGCLGLPAKRDNLLCYVTTFVESQSHIFITVILDLTARLQVC